MEKASILDGVPIPPKPVLFPKNGVIGIVVLIALAVLCVCSENWLGAAVDVVLALLVFGACWMSYNGQKFLWEKYQNLCCVDRLIRTPVLREEGHSLIFTFLAPSPKRLPEVSQFLDQIREKGNEKT